MDITNLYLKNSNMKYKITKSLKIFGQAVHLYFMKKMQKYINAEL